MSIAQLVRGKWASEVTVKRLTKTRKPQGDVSTSWGTVATGVPVLLQELTARQAQDRFGRETRVGGVAIFEASRDIRGDDGLVVTVGPSSGTKWKVVAPRDVSGHHKEFGVEQTTEAMA